MDMQTRLPVAGTRRVPLSHVTLSTVLLLALLMLVPLSVSAYAERPEGIDILTASVGTDVDGEAAPLAEEPVDTPTSGPDCSNPIPGQRVRLHAEDEVAIACRAKDAKQLGLPWMENNGTNLDWGGGWPPISDGSYDMSDVRWPAVTTADLNGDGRAEIVSVFRDRNERLSVVTDAGGNPWYRGSGNEAGDVEWLAIAAGDLDRSGSRDEIVIALKCDIDDLVLFVLSGDNAGNIQQPPESYLNTWYDPGEYGRGDVKYVALATGDLNGDGWNDEIVTVFKDGDNHLQALVFRYDPAHSWLGQVGGIIWTTHDRDNVADDSSERGNYRPISVTTGDVDGDKRDEAILAFRSGDEFIGDVQMLVLDQQPDGTFDDRVWYHRTGDAASAVSVAAGDLDGDGVDEIVLGYNSVYAYGRAVWRKHLFTYEYVPVTARDWAGCEDDNGKPVACLQERPGSWDSGETQVPLFVDEVNVEAGIVVATGDVDQDGRDEIALARQIHETGNLRVTTFDADVGLTQRDWEEVIWSGDRIEEFSLAMGDLNGDSTYGDYTGECRETIEAHVSAVIQAPPFWPDLNAADAEAGFGESVGSSQGTGQTTETMIGGSVTIGGEIPVIEIGPSLTRGWEKSASVSKETLTTTVDGTSFATTPPWSSSDPYFGAIEFVETKYWCYDYTDTKSQLGVMPVCLPRDAPEQIVLNYPLSWWYGEAPGEGRQRYSTSWVPVGINLARGRPATQVSTLESATADLAVDGNTDGNYFDGSVSHTEYDIYSWWQVDLGGVQWIDAVQIWNRTDCCQSRLTDFYVFVSDDPFPDNNPFTLASDPNIWNYRVSGQCGSPTTVPVDHHGRFVRVQLTVQNYLHMAEVQVYGRPGAPNLWPTQKPQSAGEESFTLTWPGNGTQQVNGQLLYARTAPQLGVRAASGGGEFDLGMGAEEEIVEEGSTSVTTSLGMETKVGGGEVTTGTTQKTSYILAWSQDVEFSGYVNGTPAGTDPSCDYAFQPYIWLQRARSNGGVSQQFMVLDYWVPQSGACSMTDQAMLAALERPGAVGPDVAPAVPEINCSSHPNPNVWYEEDVATFTWQQPAGDAAVIEGYRWRLDRNLDTVPPDRTRGLVTTQTFPNLRDGVWTLHARAMSEGGQWSNTGRRTIRVDANPPEVTLTVEPSRPTGNSGWYVSPVTITVTATDGTGSGIAAVEYSTDGVAWQPYTTPLSFEADTAGTTVTVRATDAAGHLSELHSTSFKIDRTPPDSHVDGGDGPGVWTAQIDADPAGNQALVLTGAIHDELSGPSGLHLSINGLDWTSAGRVGAWNPFEDRPEIEANWSFTSTLELGAGNHIFHGGALDEAGNREENYELARVVWYPEASPDLKGSTVTASHTRMRPGEEVIFLLVARNAGLQEGLIDVSDTLPEGLEPVIDKLPPGVAYDTSTRTLTWPVRLLWPGEAARYAFPARAVAGLPAGMLENEVTFHALWPNTEMLPAEEQQRFLDHEQTFVATTSVEIVPELPASADVTRPWVGLVRLSEQTVTDGQVRLGVIAASDVRRMYLREWTLDLAAGNWLIARDSGWIDYMRTVDWVLSEGQGVKYLGVWVADGAGNVSRLEEPALTFFNRTGGSQTLADGQCVQYRGDVLQGTWAVGTLTTVSGDPDLYVWRPLNSFRPDLYSNESVLPGQQEHVGGKMLTRKGCYLLEVRAVGASEYQLTMGGHGPETYAESRAADAKEVPAHPLTVSDPLSAGQAGTPGSTMPRSYFPVIIADSVEGG